MAAKKIQEFQKTQDIMNEINGFKHSFYNADTTTPSNTKNSKEITVDSYDDFNSKLNNKMKDSQ
jgi:hypothetical protein